MWLAERAVAHPKHTLANFLIWPPLRLTAGSGLSATLAFGEEAAVGDSKVLAASPLRCTSIEQPYAASRNHQVKLTERYVISNIRCLHYHLLSAQSLRSDIVGLVMTTAFGEVELQARVAMRSEAWGSDKAVRELLWIQAVRPRSLVVTRKACARVAG